MVISNDTLRGAVKCADLRVVHPLHDKLPLPRLLPPSPIVSPETKDVRCPLRSAPTYGAGVMQKCGSHLFLLVDIEELAVEWVRQLRALQLKNILDYVFLEIKRPKCPKDELISDRKSCVFLCLLDKVTESK